MLFKMYKQDIQTMYVYNAKDTFNICVNQIDHSFSKFVGWTKTANHGSNTN